MLLSRGADAARQKPDGATALSLAEENARFSVAKLLRAELGLRPAPDPIREFPADGYPDGKTMRAAARVNKAANKLKPKRPQSAPLNKTA